MTNYKYRYQYVNVLSTRYKLIIFRRSPYIFYRKGIFAIFLFGDILARLLGREDGEQSDDGERKRASQPYTPRYFAPQAHPSLVEQEHLYYRNITSPWATNNNKKKQK
jgi:hypothetical protein